MQKSQLQDHYWQRTALKTLSKKCIRDSNLLPLYIYIYVCMYVCMYKPIAQAITEQSFQEFFFLIGNENNINQDEKMKKANPRCSWW